MVIYAVYYVNMLNLSWTFIELSVTFMILNLIYKLILDIQLDTKHTAPFPKIVYELTYRTCNSLPSVIIKTDLLPTSRQKKTTKMCAVNVTMLLS